MRDSKRVFELGCGHGYIADRLSKEGFDVTGVDPSEQGIALGRQSYPALKIFEGSAYDDLRVSFGTFPIVLSHALTLKHFITLLSRAASLSSRRHITAILRTLQSQSPANGTRTIPPLWDHGHIKFWSLRTLDKLLREAGFRLVEFRRVGRFPALAKSMIAIAYK
jgi:SAM-dependent methyltransferase